MPINKTTRATVSIGFRNYDVESPRVGEGFMVCNELWLKTNEKVHKFI